MCGIVGYVGAREKREILLEGLKELEYRGYDSAGFAVLTGAQEPGKNWEKNQGKDWGQEQAQIHMQSFKATGKLKNLADKTKDFTFKGFGLGIAHTRWATHGKPTEINAHPHTGEFSYVVHNGIIENYKELKSELEGCGHTFLSQTDTEVIVHLFEQYFAKCNDARSAWEQTAKRLKGAYATLLITKAAPDRIFYAKHGAPLIIASKGAESGGETSADSRAKSSTKPQSEIYFASSDAPLIGLVDMVVYLEDGAVGDSSDFPALSPKVALAHSKSFAQKDGFRYFMEKEIYEQEQVLLETMLGRVKEDAIVLDEIDARLFEGISEISICACGTSYHAGMVGKYLLERMAGLRTNVALASELRYAKPILLQNELFIVISQSGETADTLEALKLAKAQGLRTLAICNVDNSSIVREADAVLLTRAGIEKGVASTKAFATQVMLLWILAVFLGTARGVLSEKEREKERANMIAAIAATKVGQNLHERIKRLSKRYLHGHGFFFIGRDVFYPLALEGALKLKEISYLHAEGYASGEMKHGPIALVDANLFTIALMPKHLLHEKIASNVEELSARDATICAIAQDEFALADDWIAIAKASSYMEEFFAMMVALQLLALEIAVRLGNDVDMPRNLAKSVTVE